MIHSGMTMVEIVKAICRHSRLNPFSRTAPTGDSIREKLNGKSKKGRADCSQRARNQITQRRKI